MAVTNLTKAQYDAALAKATPDQKMKLQNAFNAGQIKIVQDASQAYQSGTIGAGKPAVIAPTTPTIVSTVAKPATTSTQRAVSNTEMEQLYNKYGADTSKLYSNDLFKKFSSDNQKAVQNYFSSKATPQPVTKATTTGPAANANILDKTNTLQKNLGATDKAYQDYNAYANTYLNDKIAEYNKKYSTLEGMYNQQNEEFKTKYSALQNQIASNEKQLNDDFAKIRSSADEYKKTQDKVVANRLAGQKAGLTNQLGSAGASQSLINDALAKQEEQALADVNAVQKQYVDSLQNTANQYQTAARNILNDKEGLTESERLLANQYIQRSEDLLKDKETFQNEVRNFALKPYFDKVQGQLESTQAIEKEIATTQAENSQYASSKAADKKMLLVKKLKLDDLVSTGQLTADNLNAILDDAINSGVSFAGAIAKVRDKLVSANNAAAMKASTIPSIPPFSSTNKNRSNQKIIDAVKKQQANQSGSTANATKTNADLIAQTAVSTAQTAAPETVLVAKYAKPILQSAKNMFTTGLKSGNITSAAADASNALKGLGSTLKASGSVVKAADVVAEATKLSKAAKALNLVKSGGSIAGKLASKLALPVATLFAINATNNALKNGEIAADDIYSKLAFFIDDMAFGLLPDTFWNYKNIPNMDPELSKQFQDDIELHKTYGNAGSASYGAGSNLSL